MKLAFFIMTCVIFTGCTEAARQQAEHDVSGEMNPVISLPVDYHITPDDERLRYTGRIDFRDSLAPSFSLSGVTISLQTTATHVNAQFIDHAKGGRQFTNYLEVIVDGTPHRTIALAPGKDSTYLLAEGLDSTQHLIEVVKRTEAGVGKCTFKGIYFPEGAHATKPDTPRHTIAFIGNSITCGYGNEAVIPEPPAGNPTTGFNARNQNAYTTYAAQCARYFHADATFFCYSGKGVYRNFGGGKKHTIPVMYDRVYPDFSYPKWDFDKQTRPDIVVIALGTNDFANDPQQPLNDLAFREKYLLFALMVHQYNPGASIILCTSPMVNDDYPGRAQHRKRLQKSLDWVAQQYAKQASNAIHIVDFPSQKGPYGEDWHPAPHTHKEMAEQLIRLIEKKSLLH